MRFIFIISFFILSIFHNSVLATDYIFNGNGSWNDINNWVGGIKPPDYLQSGSTITVSGTAYVGIGCVPGMVGQCSDPGVFGGIYNGGTLIITVGGSLALQNYTQFQHQGSIIVDGTLITSTVFEGYSVGSVTVNGTLVNKRIYGNQGLVTINNNGVINNEGIFTNTGSGWDFVFPIIGRLVINNGGIFNNIGIGKLGAGNLTNNGTISNQSKLIGNATITGSLINEGTIAPGNSPGIYTITGNYTASNTAIHNFEIGGVTSSLYDKLIVGGTSTLGGTLNVSLINGFVPSAAHEIPIITGTVSGTFATINIPASYVLVYRSNEVVLQKFSVLPVSFKSIDVKKLTNSVVLNWQIENEHDVLKYDIERSNDGRIFETIGFVKAIGQSYYYFQDKSSQGRIYYRIKSIDHDGSIKYSSIVNYVDGKSSVPFKVIPFNNKLIVQHTSANDRSTLSIFSIDGKLLNTFKATPGTQKTEIDLTGLSNGSYFIIYNNENILERQKFIK